MLKKELQPIIDEINKFSEQIRGEHSTATYKSLNELVVSIETKFDISLRNQFSVFNKFRTNFEKFSKSQSLTEKSTKPKDDEFVFIPSKWQFRPDNLTEHQKEKLKEKRVDIPALYNDMSQSQDSHSISLKPWTPKRQLQSNPAEPPSQVDKCDDANNDTKSSDTKTETDGALDNAIINDLQPSQSNSGTMASTSLDNNTNATNNNVNQSTPSKVDEEERKRKRVQYELNKLQLSIINPEQYSNQGRTRRMSVNLTKPEQRLLKRTLTVTPKTTPIKKTRRATATSTDNSESESSEIIEASQTPTTTTPRRGRQKKSSLIKTQVIKVEESNAEKSSENEEISLCSDEKNVLLNISVDSRSIGNETTIEKETTVIQQTELATTVPETKDEKSCITQDNDTDSEKVQNANASVDDINSNAEISTETSEEVAIPQENNVHSPIEDAHSEVITPEDIVTSPVRKQSDEDLLEAETSGIITSPSSNKNCSKTTELLNSTVDISPILHPKAKNSEQTSESKTNQQERIIETECCTENIDTDQIKRTELDNLIKSPMDSPMLQAQKQYNVPYSTPQSHKDTKRKFQLQGRGAQLLQLMNIRKVEEASLQNVKAKTPVHVNEATTAPAETVPPNANNLLTYDDILANNKDLFRFSKILPSPHASPSSSILSKRNISEITEIDDIESPNQKRKRVSFHDPPVSATKEFIRFAEEVNPNRIRVNRNNISPLNVRNVLTRKCRSDSLNEIKKFTLPFDDLTSEKSETSMKSLKFNATDDEEEVSALPLITFTNKDEVLQHVFDEYPIEDVLGKYFGSGFTMNDATSKIFGNQLTTLMKNDETKRKLFLEDLSEKFPKEFLDVAFQENLTSTVIGRLPPTNMLNHITEQAKTDNNLKLQLIDKFATVIADTSSTNTEMKDDVYKLLLGIIAQKMSDKQLLDVLDIVFEKRRTNSCS